MSDAPLKIMFPQLRQTLRADRGDNLLALIREAGITLRADCGGAGRCKKCKVTVNGTVCLACKTHITEDSEVNIVPQQSNEGYSILTEYENTLLSTTKTASPSPHEGSSNYALAIDVGTTTIAGKLVDLSRGFEVASFAGLNTQRPYGADVLSRVEASLDDSSTLSRLITKQIDREIASLLAEQGVSRDAVGKLVIAGNTAMSYILLGYPCRSLGFAPFKPARAIDGPFPYRELFCTNTLTCLCDVLPFLSAFVGGDLFAGLCALSNEDDFILMDLGTNGELLFKRKDRLICTATAVGPAFEGGDIECGSGSTQGAISSVCYEDKTFKYQTIGAAPATSICGSGILDLMAILVREGFVDVSGRLFGNREGDQRSKQESDRVILSEGVENTGAASVFFTQKDVRQFQLAKSAIRAGLEIIQKEMGGSAPSRVFLAGGFGQNLNPESACACGLLPEAFRGRVVPIGNSSLSGAVKICLNDSVRAKTAAWIAKAQEINLALHPLFSDLFMEHMAF
jgi:uncharacterized 2Fe-2S/4Fe-4S cluster protein (DUF4445 family)